MKTQREYVLNYFKKNPNKNISHPEIVDFLSELYNKETGRIFRDPDRAIRKLHQEGVLQKINKGIYRYNPNFIKKKKLYDFSQKQIILKRDNYKCVICGLSEREGFELHIDHIKPKDFGGRSVIENGQILCSKHNFQKKNYKQTETGKKMFIRLYELAIKEKDDMLIKFCEEILQVYENNNINGPYCLGEERKR